MQATVVGTMSSVVPGGAHVSGHHVTCAHMTSLSCAATWGRMTFREKAVHLTPCEVCVYAVLSVFSVRCACVFWVHALAVYTVCGICGLYVMMSVCCVYL